MDHNQVRNLYRVIAQVRWEVKPNFLPKQLAITVEEVELEAKDHEPVEVVMERFIPTLAELVRDGREAPGLPGSICTPVSVYGEILSRKKISGVVDDEDGEQPEPTPDEKNKVLTQTPKELEENGAASTASEGTVTETE